MIYSSVSPDHPVDQGDIIDGCPALSIREFDRSQPDKPKVACDLVRSYVLTQTCDLAHGKTTLVTIAVVLDAAKLVADGELKAANVRGSIRSGRVHGWYFLPKSAAFGLPESIVDLRNLHVVPLNVLETLCRDGRRVAHLESLYREHLAQHFANAYCRIGLPMPYETD
jgi:hypothetical protein